MAVSWTPGTDVPGAISRGASGFRRHRVGILLSVVLLLSVVAGWALYAMHTNAAHAHSWERRAGVLETDERQLQSLLSARSRLLNQRIDQVNDFAGKLRSSQVALGRSQGDVSSLEVRQRELANEKAQLQDQQAALHQVVDSFVTCQGDLVSVVSDLAGSYDPTYDFQLAETDCGGADNAFQGYLNNWPNG
jgi:TolA-binding protein